MSDDKDTPRERACRLATGMSSASTVMVSFCFIGSGGPCFPVYRHGNQVYVCRGRRPGGQTGTMPDSLIWGSGVIGITELPATPCAPPPVAVWLPAEIACHDGGKPAMSAPASDAAPRCPHGAYRAHSPGPMLRPQVLVPVAAQSGRLAGGLANRPIMMSLPGPVTSSAPQRTADGSILSARRLWGSVGLRQRVPEQPIPYRPMRGGQPRFAPDPATIRSSVHIHWHRLAPLHP